MGTIVDLKLLQDSLISNPEIENKVRQQKDFPITIQYLKENDRDFQEELLIFGEQTIIFRFLLIDGNLQGMTLKLYVDDVDEQIKIFDAADPMNPVSDKDLNYVRYKTGIGGYQWLQASGFENSIISIPLSLNPDYEQKLKDSNYDLSLIEEKSGLAPASFLKYRPRPTIKLKDLKEKSEYQVLKYLGTSKMYAKSKRYAMQEVRGDKLLGEPFEIYTNTSLSKIIERNKLPVNVVVAGKKDNPKGEGVIVNFVLASMAQLKV